MTIYGLIKCNADGSEIDVVNTSDFDFDATNYCDELQQAGAELIDVDMYDSYAAGEKDHFFHEGIEYIIREITDDDFGLINNSVTMSNLKSEIVRKNCVCGAYNQTFAQLWKAYPHDLIGLPALTIASILNAMQDRYQAGRASHKGFDVCDDCLWIPIAGERHTEKEKEEMKKRGSQVTEYTGMLLPLMAFRELKKTEGIVNREVTSTVISYVGGKEIREEKQKIVESNYTRYTLDYTEYW